MFVLIAQSTPCLALDRYCSTSHRFLTAPTCSSDMRATRSNLLTSAWRQVATDSNGWPPSELKIVFEQDQMGSTPKLSYTPPSVRRMFFATTGFRFSELGRVCPHGSTRDISFTL